METFLRDAEDRALSESGVSGLHRSLSTCHMQRRGKGARKSPFSRHFYPGFFCSPFPLKLNSSRCQAAVCWWHRGEHEGPQHSDHGPVYLGKRGGASRKQGLQPAQVPQGLRCAATIPFDAYRLPQGTCPDPWALVRLSDGGTMGTRTQTPLLLKQQLILSHGII